MTKFRDHQKRRDGSPYRIRLSKNELKQRLQNITEVNVDLKQTAIVLETEHLEAERSVEVLEHEIETLKKRISNFKLKTIKEEARLRSTVNKLKAELFDLGVPKIGVKKHLDRKTRYIRKQNLDDSKQREMDYSEAVSAQGVPVWDQGTRLTGRSRKHVRPRRQSENRREKVRIRPAVRRMSTPLSSVNLNYTQQSKNSKSKCNYSVKEVEAAARAFNDIFREMGPIEMEMLWKDFDVLVRKKDELVLDIRNIPLLLHRLVIYAFKVDNPDKAAPSRHRTKPIVSLLEIRLGPYTQNRRYLSIDDFLKFPIWLGNMEEVQRLKPPVSFSKRNSMLPIVESDGRRNLKVGSSCLVWSDGAKSWCVGEVINTKFDNEGEWLVVRYCYMSKLLEKEVQRFSDLLLAYEV